MSENTEQIGVRFFTKTYPHEMPPRTYMIPTNFTLTGLSELLNKELSLDEPVRFCFLHEGEFIIYETLQKWILRKQIGKEAELELEYTPSFDMEVGQNIPHDDWVSCIRRLPVPVNPEDPALQPYLTTSYDKCVRLWQGTQCLAMLKAHNRSIKQASVIDADEAKGSGAKRKRVPLRCSFATASSDATVRVWRFEDEAFSQVCTLKHAEAVESVTVHAEKALLGSAGWDKTVKVWKLDKILEGVTDEAEVLHCTLSGSSRAVMVTEWSPHHRQLLYSGGLDGSIRVWDVVRQIQCSHMTVDASPCYSMDVRSSEGNDFVLTGHSDNRIRMWDLRSPNTTVTFSGHKGWVFGAAWHGAPGESMAGSRRQFSSASEDGTVAMWDVRANRPLSVSDSHKGGVLCVTWLNATSGPASRKGQSACVLLSGGKDNEVHTWTAFAP
eukprot:TRINITY_DN57044_c0_g1_i1.p1 TRINITY_DN57044_c0_g1~~TRINITY_DN57044_c0_g1_i1.p1  ORF type:complete len:454 (-),score=98.31 TRINITY_DN57044_c0_g1_i1:376-1692(-)